MYYINHFIIIFIILSISNSAFATRRIRKLDDMEFGTITYSAAPINITIVGNGSLTASTIFSYNPGEVVEGNFRVQGNVGDVIEILIPSSTTLTGTTGTGTITLTNYTISGGTTTYTVSDSTNDVTRQIQATASIPDTTYTGTYTGSISLSTRWTRPNGTMVVKRRNMLVSINVSNSVEFNEARQLDFGTILIENNNACIVNLSQNNQMNSTCPQVSNSNTGLYSINTNAILEQSQITISNTNQLNNITGDILVTSNEQVYLKSITGGYQIEAAASLAIDGNTPTGVYTGNIYITINY